MIISPENERTAGLSASTWTFLALIPAPLPFLLVASQTLMMVLHFILSWFFFFAMIYFSRLDSLDSLDSRRFFSPLVSSFGRFVTGLSLFSRYAFGPRISTSDEGYMDRCRL
jgi:hypothetical protein